jgi:hypothetical protein
VWLRNAIRGLWQPNPASRGRRNETGDLENTHPTSEGIETLTPGLSTMNSRSLPSVCVHLQIGLCPVAVPKPGGSNPCWGANGRFRIHAGPPETLRNVERKVCNNEFLGSHYLCAPTPNAYFVDSSPSGQLGTYPPHSAGFRMSCVLSGWKRGIVRVHTQPVGLRPNPTFSPANSPVSLVDRSRLLTASSNVGSRADSFEHPGAVPAEVLLVFIGYPAPFHELAEP